MIKSLYNKYKFNKLICNKPLSIRQDIIIKELKKERQIRLSMGYSMPSRGLIANAQSFNCR